MSLSSSLLWRGLLAIAIGIDISIGKLAVYIAAGIDVMRAFASDRAGRVAGYLLAVV